MNGYYVTVRRPGPMMERETDVEQAIVHDRCRLENNGLVQDPDGDVFVLRVDSMAYGYHFAMHDCMILPSAIPVAPGLKKRKGIDC